MGKVILLTFLVGLILLTPISVHTESGIGSFRMGDLNNNGGIPDSLDFGAEFRDNKNIRMINSKHISNPSEKIKAVIITTAFSYPHEKESRPDNLQGGKFLHTTSIFPSVVRREPISDEIIGSSNRDYLSKITSFAGGNEVVIMGYMGHGANKSVEFEYGAMSMPISKLCVDIKKELALIDKIYFDEMTDEERASKRGQDMVKRFKLELVPSEKQNNCLPEDSFIGFDKLSTALNGSDLIFFNGACHSGLASQGLSGNYILAAAASGSEVTTSFHDNANSKTLREYKLADEYKREYSVSAFYSELYERAMGKRACWLDSNQDSILTVSEYLKDFPFQLSGGLIVLNQVFSDMTLTEQRAEIYELGKGVSDKTKKIFTEDVNHSVIDTDSSSEKIRTFTVKMLDSKQCSFFDKEFAEMGKKNMALRNQITDELFLNLSYLSPDEKETLLKASSGFK